MKKILILALLTIIALCLLASCGGQKDGHFHSYAEWKTTKTPTCTEDGVESRYCDCGEKQTEVISATGHNYVDGECINCGDVKETPECNHDNLDILSAVESTCKEHGLTEGIICLDCGKALLAQKEMPLKPHTEVINPARAATCTTNGLTEGKHCSTCGTILVGQETIPAKGHTEIVAPAVAPTCTTSGLTEGKYCSTCTTILVTQTTTPATGHTKVVDKAIAATCTKTGLTEGKHCSVCNKTLVEQKTIPAKGHSFNNGRIIKEATATEEGLQERYCACGEIRSEILPTLGTFEFSFAIDNAIYSGAEFVNGGRIKLTIFYKAANVDLANVAIRINYNADVLSYVSGDFACDAKDADDNRIFPIDAAAIGGATPGFVVVTAATTGFGQNPIDKNLYGDGIFAEVYFNVKNNVVAGSKFDFVLDTDATLSATHVRTADKSEVAATFNEIPNDATTKALGDIDIDSKFTVNDEVELISLLEAGAYSAMADITQDGTVDEYDHQLLLDVLLGTKTYGDMCEAAQQQNANK